MLNKQLYSRAFGWPFVDKKIKPYEDINNYRH